MDNCKTISQIRRILCSILAPLLADEATATARLIVCEKLQLTFTEMVLKDNDLVSVADEQTMLSWSERILAHEPLQYIVGHAQFMGLDFHVEPSVLIPRPETEGLVDWIVEQNADRVVRLLDIGTGSGCIAIALKHLMPRSTVDALDVSADALQVAKLNAKNNNAELNLFHADILQPFTTSNQYDIIVSNPPYVRDSERHTMRPNVLNHEPHTALFVPDADPLLFYREIAVKAKANLLAQGGQLFFEINEQLGNETVSMLRALGYTDIELRQDYCGKERMVRAILK